MDLTRFKSHGVVKSRNRKEFSCIYTQCTVFFPFYGICHLYFNSCFVLTYVFLILFLVMGTFGEILFCCVKILSCKTLLKF